MKAFLTGGTEGKVLVIFAEDFDKVAKEFHGTYSISEEGNEKVFHLRIPESEFKPSGEKITINGEEKDLLKLQRGPLSLITYSDSGGCEISFVEILSLFL
jgi:hypothetical protein